MSGFWPEAEERRVAVHALCGAAVAIACGFAVLQIRQLEQTRHFDASSPQARFTAYQRGLVGVKCGDGARKEDYPTRIETAQQLEEIRQSSQCAVYPHVQIVHKMPDNQPLPTQTVQSAAGYEMFRRGKLKIFCRDDATGDDYAPGIADYAGYRQRVADAACLAQPQ